MKNNLLCTLFTAIPGPPGRPDVFDVSRDGMTITWLPPETDGGSQVSGYIIERKEVRSDRWVRINKNPVTMTRYRSMGLIEGLEYEHRVTAINSRGSGKPSPTSKSVVAMDPIGRFFFFSNFLELKSFTLINGLNCCFHAPKQIHLVYH